MKLSGRLNTGFVAGFASGTTGDEKQWKALEETCVSCLTIREIDSIWMGDIEHSGEESE